MSDNQIQFNVSYLIAAAGFLETMRSEYQFQHAQSKINQIITNNEPARVAYNRYTSEVDNLNKFILGEFNEPTMDVRDYKNKVAEYRKNIQNFVDEIGQITSDEGKLMKRLVNITRQNVLERFLYLGIGLTAMVIAIFRDERLMKTRQ